MFKIRNLNQIVPIADLVVLLYADHVHRRVKIRGKRRAAAEPDQLVSLAHFVAFRNIDIPYRRVGVRGVGFAVPQGQASAEAQRIGDGPRRRGIFIIGHCILISQLRPGVEAHAACNHQDDQNQDDFPEDPFFLPAAVLSVRAAHPLQTLLSNMNGFILPYHDEQRYCLM